MSGVVSAVVVCALALLLLWLTSWCVPKGLRRCFRKDHVVTPTGQQMATLPRSDKNEQQTPRKRLKSLDTFRGCVLTHSR